MVDPNDPLEASTSPVNEQALRILEELEREGTMLGDYGISNIQLIGMMIAAVVLAFIWQKLGSPTLAFPGSRLFWLAIIPGLAAAGYLRLRARMLGDEHRGYAAFHLVESGLLERLLLGMDQLPDIHAAVSFPWQPLLGSRPRTLLDSLKLFARNLDWYLRPVDPYVKRSWKILLGVLVILPLWIVMFIMYRSQQWGPGLAQDFDLAFIFFFLIPSVIFTGLAILGELALQDGIRQRAVFKALVHLLGKRLAGDIEQPEESADAFEC